VRAVRGKYTSHTYATGGTASMAMMWDVECGDGCGMWGCGDASLEPPLFLLLT